MFSQFFEKNQKWSLIVSTLMLLLAIFLIFRPLEFLNTFIMLFAIIILAITQAINLVEGIVTVVKMKK